MKDLFPGYYQPTEFSMWKEDNCLFVLDANILLNLYRYKTSTQETLFEILSKFSDRLFLPYQAAYEYQKNRITVITEQEEAYSKVEDIFKDNLNKIKIALNSYLKHPSISVEELKEKLNIFEAETIKDLTEKKDGHPSLIYTDPIREQLDVLFSNKVGEKYQLTADDDKRFQERYDNKVPPGYEDNKKTENKFGDLIVWMEVMEKASKGFNIILVTDDVKEDWWWKPKGKTFGPRPELIEEFIKTTGQSIFIYQTEAFIKYAQQYLGTSNENADEAIEDVKSVKKLDEAALNLQKSYENFTKHLKSDNNIKIDSNDRGVGVLFDELRNNEGYNEWIVKSPVNFKELIKDGAFEDYRLTLSPKWHKKLYADQTYTSFLEKKLYDYGERKKESQIKEEENSDDE